MMAVDVASPKEQSKSLAVSIVQDATPDVPIDRVPRSRWKKIREVIWDGGYRTKEERKLVQRLDLHVMFVNTPPIPIPIPIPF